MNYIGIDCHITSLEFAVVNETGRVVETGSVATSAGNLIEYLKGIRSPKVAYIEESSLADWILETCNAYGEKLVITNSKENRWIGASESKNDKLDAKKLARLARGGYIKEVYHPVGERRRFKELMLGYDDAVRSCTRVKNKTKSKFRSNGIQCRGETIYKKAHREEWRAKLPNDPSLLLIVDRLWCQMDLLEETKRRLLATGAKESKKYPEIKRFLKIPGVGFITAATVSAIVENPWRFNDKSKLWAYAGFGIAKRTSGGKVYLEGLNRDYNRTLKYIIKSAIERMVQAKDNPFRRKYLDMTLLYGVSEKRAKLILGRSLLAMMLAMWKKGEEYSPELAGRKTTRKARM